MIRLKLYAAAIGAFILALITFGASQRKAERTKNELRRLKEARDTAERIDNAKPADNAADARANLTGWLSRRKR